MPMYCLFVERWISGSIMPMFRHLDPLFVACREDGERAIRTLNGYGYGHLILKVEWAAPREERK